MQRKLTKAGAFWLTFLFSILLFLATFWSFAFQDNTSYWVESLGFFLLTYICIDEISKLISNVNAWMIGLAVILGQLVIHVPFRITDFWGGLGSVMVAISGLMATVLAVFCYKDRRPYTFILSYVVLILYNSVVAEMWNNYVTELK